MTTIEVSRVIAAPPELLYDIVSDLRRMGELSPENTGGMWINGATGPLVGAQFRGTNSNEDKNKHWATVATIEEAEPGKVFTFRVGVGPIKISRWSYRFEPVAGGTQVTETWTDLRNRFTKRIGRWSSGVADREHRNRENMEVTLVNLARASRDAQVGG